MLVTLSHTGCLLQRERGSRRERFQSAGNKIQAKLNTHTKELKDLRLQVVSFISNSLMIPFLKFFQKLCLILCSIQVTFKGYKQGSTTTVIWNFTNGTDKNHPGKILNGLILEKLFFLFLCYQNKKGMTQNKNLIQ